MNKSTFKDLSKHAQSIRDSIMEMAFAAQGAHTGGSLSCVEILTTLYFSIMNVYPRNTNHPERDRLIFSKAHDCKVLYASLAERGFFPKKILKTYEKDGGLPGHSTRSSAPGVEVSAGSLGHGLSIAVGIAYAGKINKSKFKTYAVLSDGECDEGSTWEAILFAGHHHLNKLIVVVDYNKLQAFGSTDEILSLEPFAEKWNHFGWKSYEVDGHDIAELHKALIDTQKNHKPSVIIAHTIKGYKGVPRYENKIVSHYKPPTIDDMKEYRKRSKFI